MTGPNRRGHTTFQTRKRIEEFEFRYDGHLN